MAHAHDHPQGSINRSRLLAAFIVTVIFMLAEVFGGWMSGSLALLADAGHMLTDAAALLLSLLATHFAQRKSDPHQTYGMLRLTTLSAFVNALALLLITVLIVYEAVVRFFAPEPVAGGLMTAIAVAGLLANLLCFFLLRHGDGEQNMNIRGAVLHVLGDLLGSVGAIIAALLIIWTGWTPFDPILSILVSLLIVRSAWQLLRQSSRELLESAPADIDVNKLARQLTLNIAEVRHVHHVHFWQVGEKNVLTLHAQVIPNYQHDQLLQRIHQWLQSHYSVDHVTVQIEYQPCQQTECLLTRTTDIHSVHSHSGSEHRDGTRGTRSGTQVHRH